MRDTAPNMKVPISQSEAYPIDKSKKVENSNTEDSANQSCPTKPRFTSTSYPSNCLQFLKNVKSTQGLEGQSEGPASPSTARIELDVIVVGAGLGGLAAAIALARSGHKVTVFEQAPVLAEVGAGIQIPPNAGKLLSRWGVIDDLGDQIVQPDGISFRRWSNGKQIGFTDLSSTFADAYGIPYHVAHRAHLHSAMHKRAVKLGVDVRLGCRITTYEPNTPSITLEDDTVVMADLVVGADGLKSAAREYISPGPRSLPKSTGFAVYRATVDVNKMREIPELAWILERPSLNIWVGEDRHVMTYTIASGQSFNMVLSHVDNSDASLWPQMSQGKIIKDMRNEFEGWDSQLCKIINLINHALKWPLMGNNSLDTWLSQSSKLVAIGDAAHAMVPYMSQGAAMAIEDGATLAVAVSKIASVSELPFALKIFEKERKKRSGMMQEASMVNAMIWHFADGPEQKARDDAMKSEAEGRHFLSSPNQWSDPQTQEWAYGYDAEKVMEERWDEAIRDLIATRSGS